MAEIVNVRLRTDTLARLDTQREAYGLARARWIELVILAALESGWTPTGKQLAANSTESGLSALLTVVTTSGKVVTTTEQRSR
jgi:hypothetical protein